MKPKRIAALTYYYAARDWLLSSQFYSEVLRQAVADYETVTETDLLREHAWVVLNSGFREAVIRARFGNISLCFCDWESAEAIAHAGVACVVSAKYSFRNERKLNSILAAAQLINELGFENFRQQMIKNPVGALMQLPYIGQVTSLHLAKNLGLNVAKPDRHLVRLAKQFNFPSVYELCRELAGETGDQESIVDLVLWRFEEQAGRASPHSPPARPAPSRAAA